MHFYCELADELPEHVLALSDRIDKVDTKLDLILAYIHESSTLPKEESKHRLIGVSEACDILHLARPTVYGMVREHKLPCIKKGRKIYFFTDELEEWFENGRVEVIDKTPGDHVLEIAKSFKHKPSKFDF